MPKVVFKPTGQSIDVAAKTKLLVAGIKAEAPIRFGCASCKCGTCGIKVSNPGVLNDIDAHEHALLVRLKLSTEGTVRLACKARIVSGECEVDLDFQDAYSPSDAD